MQRFIWRKKFIPHLIHSYRFFFFLNYNMPSNIRFVKKYIYIFCLSRGRKRKSVMKHVKPLLSCPQKFLSKRGNIWRQSWVWGGEDIKLHFSSLHFLFIIMEWKIIKKFQFFRFSYFFTFIFVSRMWTKWRAKFHTSEGCRTENTIMSAAEGFNPFPKSTDFWAKPSFNPLITPKHELESRGKLSANVIHFITYNQIFSFVRLKKKF